MHGRCTDWDVCMVLLHKHATMPETIEGALLILPVESISMLLQGW